MKFERPLVDGVLIKRYKRFLADVKLVETGEIILAHVPNSGSMLGVSDSGSSCRVSISDVITRKIPYTLEMVKTPSGEWVGVNTSLTNKLVREAFEKKKISDWKKFVSIQGEVKINKESRLDFLLSNGTKKRFVEVKNVSMAKPPWAVFPDAVTLRGQKHLYDLMKLAKKGDEAEIFFVVQRQDCKLFKPCDEIDPEYGRLLRKCIKQKVIIRCWACAINSENIELHHELEVDLS